jgi:hypothetical protein
MIYLVHLKPQQILKNKNNLPGEILQCCRVASYILLATWQNPLGYQKPLGYDSKLNVLNINMLFFPCAVCTLQQT